MIDKKKSVDYWNNVAKDWKKMAYNTDKPALIFPSSQIRQEIVVKEIKKHMNKNAKILDMGCADGSLVIELIKNGYTNVKGIDNSQNMITEAKIQLRKTGYGFNNIFEVADADGYKTKEKFDIVIAMGLIEYVKNADSFAKLVCDLLKKDGVAYIESKNKLFNVFSANEFTIKSCLTTLIPEILEVAYLSPNKLEDVIKEIKHSYDIEFPKQKGKRRYKKYPFELPQYTSKELLKIFEKYKMRAKKVVYYHYHPFPPPYRDDFPEFYDELSIRLQPLGYTHIGASMCSSFVMVIKK
jgi:2-polyprenyl-3-methyl-5-hydroxy-6-metoxy-1,4-benzoquinol methylase